MILDNLNQPEADGENMPLRLALDPLESIFSPEVASSPAPIDSGASYDESSITLHNEPMDARFDWRLAEEWSRQFNRPQEWILRSILAYRECGLTPELFRDRYLLKLKDAPRREDAEAASTRLQREGIRT